MIYILIATIGIAAIVLYYLSKKGFTTPTRAVQTRICYISESDGIKHKYKKWAENISYKQLNKEINLILCNLEWIKWSLTETYYDDNGRMTNCIENITYNDSYYQQHNVLNYK